MRWLQRRRERREMESGRYCCKRCGGWLETGMPYPHAAQIHIRHYCPDLDPAEAAREIVRVLERYDRATAR